MRILKALLFLCSGLLLLACGVHVAQSGRPPDPLPEKSEGALRIATHNVHYIVLGQSEGRWSVADWEARKTALGAAFKAIDADIVAFQEMESFSRGSDGSVNLTLDYLLAETPGHGAAAVGDWREFPSTQPILYRRDRVEVLDQGWFFFSETPDVIYSRTFNGSWPAFASWARFRDRTTGAAFRVVNVHFEYRSRSNRRLSAALVAERTGPWIAAGETVILAGDLNAMHGARTLELLEDAGFAFLPVDGATYHFDRGINLFGAIDHLAVSGGAAAAGPPVVLRERFAGDWPSDHYPVFADLLIGP